MKTAAEIYERHKRAIRSAIFRWAAAPEGYPTTNKTFVAEIERAVITAIEAAIAEETARCAEAVARMKNQRQAYREILGDPTARLPRHGHWADPFFAEAEASVARMPTPLASVARDEPG